MMTLEILRALAGIAASTTIDQGVKDKANELMFTALHSLEKMITIEAEAVTREKAASNGVIL